MFVKNIFFHFFGHFWSFSQSIFQYKVATPAAAVAPGDPALGVVSSFEISQCLCPGRLMSEFLRDLGIPRCPARFKVLFRAPQPHHCC